MKLIIDIDEELYNQLCEDHSYNSAKIAYRELMNGKPYEERPQGDLISREALKKALKSNCDTLCPDKNTNWCEHCCPLNDFEDLIDNAPTVEINTNEIEYKAYCKGLEDGKKITRPQGEWITHQTGMLLWEECNQCHAQVGTVGMNFCPNCGADMRGGAE